MKQEQGSDVGTHSDGISSERDPSDASTPSGHLTATAYDDAAVYQAARDLHVHHRDGVRQVQRTETGSSSTGSAAAECPYPGLSAFDAHQASWFFGRDRITADLVERVADRATAGGILMVVAPSGAGKSSLLRAGLLPAVARGALPTRGSAQWPRIIMTPTEDPFRSLRAALRVVEGSENAAVDAPALITAIEGMAERGGRVLLVVDQLEELFTVCDSEAARTSFIDLLTHVARPHGAAVVVTGLRADYYGRCADYPELREALQRSPVVVGPMSETELREAILFPAEQTGLQLESGLIALLLNDLGTVDGGDTARESGRLPLLAYALQATWRQRNGHTLTVAGYLTTGGIHHAITRAADRILADLDREGVAAARQLFLRLVNIGVGAEDSRRRVARADLLRSATSAEAATRVLDAFVGARLLTVSRDHVEITHEALLRAWPRLRQWIDSDRAGNAIRQDIEDDAASWAATGFRDTSFLYQGTRLEAAIQVTDQAPNQSHSLSTDAALFLSTSRRRQRRDTRRRRSAVIALVALTVIATTGAIFALKQRTDAQASDRAARQSATDFKRQRDVAVVNNIVAEANQVRASNPSLAAQLDLAAYRLLTDTARGAALLSEPSAVLSKPLGPAATEPSIAFTPDSHTLAGAYSDGMLQLWDVSDPSKVTPLGRVRANTNKLEAVAVNPHGGTLATVGDDDTATGDSKKVVRLWDISDLHNPRQLSKLDVGATDVGKIAFSSDGKLLAAAIDNGIRFWDVTDPAHPRAESEPVHVSVDSSGAATVTALAFSAHGDLLASSDSAGIVQLWSVADGQHVAAVGPPLSSSKGGSALAFDKSGHTLYGEGKRWSVADPANPHLLGALPTDAGDALALSADGHTMVTSDATTSGINVWDPTGSPSPDAVHTLLGDHGSAVMALAVSPNGKVIASGSNGDSVRLWSAADPEQPLAFVKAVSADPLDTPALGPDGTALVGNGLDGVDLISLTGSAPRKLMPGVALSSSAVSPDGTLIAGTDSILAKSPRFGLWKVSGSTSEPVGSASGDGQVIFDPRGHTLVVGASLWNVDHPAQPKPLGKPLVKDVEAAAVSADGHLLALGANGKLSLWDVTDPAHPVGKAASVVYPDDTLGEIAFRPDGRVFATIDGEQEINGTSYVRLWKIGPTGAVTAAANPIVNRDYNDTAITFTPDGSGIVVASDGAIKRWDVSDPDHPVPLGQPMTEREYPLGVHGVTADDGIQWLAVSGDGETIITAGDNVPVALWSLDVSRATTAICAWDGGLTAAQWSQYVSASLPYQPSCH